LKATKTFVADIKLFLKGKINPSVSEIAGAEQRRKKNLKITRGEVTTRPGPRESEGWPNVLQTTSREEFVTVKLQ
jgi:hypothetical protein